MRCDMCGSEEQLFNTKLEGAEMQVCKSCSNYGEVISKVTKAKEKKEDKSEVREEPERSKVITVIKDGYPEMIKSERESRGLKQEEMAHKIGEKESVIHHLETGRMEPSIDLARKVEKFLDIELVDEYEEKLEREQKSTSKSMTIGDMVQIQ